MNSIDDIVKDAKKLASKIQGGEDAEKVIAVPSSDSFRQSMLIFLQNRMEDVRKNMSMIDIIDAILVEKVVLKELSAMELMKLRNSVQQSANIATSTILEPFKPSNNTGSTLLNPPKDDSSTAQIADQLTPEQRVAVNKLEQFMNIIATKVQDKEKIESKENE